MDEQNQQDNYWNPATDEVPVDAAPEQPSVPVVPQAQPLAQSHSAPAQPQPEAPAAYALTWTAKEYLHVERNALWFVWFVIIVVVLTAASIFLLKAWTFSVLILVMAFSLIVYIRRPARDISYNLSPNEGLYIDDVLYRYDDIKTFGLIRDGQDEYLMLIPRKRFSPALSVFFTPEVGADLIDALGARIPMDDLQSDFIDKLIRKLRL